MLRSDSVEYVEPAKPGELAHFAFVPKSALDSESPSIVIAVHGISLSAREQIDAFTPWAAARGHVLLAPCFDTPEDRDYQRLGRRGRGRRADLALDLAIERLAVGLDARFPRRIFFGYSGGGQFVHRYLMAHPDRVTAAVVAAAGWYTLPDARLAYPMGLRVGGKLAGVEMLPSRFLSVPVLALVGSRDLGRDESVRTNTKVDARQGTDRVARAHRWIGEMRAAAAARGLPARHELIELPEAGHSFLECVEAGLAKATFDFFDSVPGIAPDSPKPEHPTDGSAAR